MFSKEGGCPFFPHHHIDSSLLFLQTARPKPVTQQVKTFTNRLLSTVGIYTNDLTKEMRWALRRAENIPMKVSVASIFPIRLADWKKVPFLEDWCPVCNKEGIGEVGREGLGHAPSWQLPEDDHSRKNSQCWQACPLRSPRRSDCTMLGTGNHSSLSSFCPKDLAIPCNRLEKYSFPANRKPPTWQGDR